MRKLRLIGLTAIAVSVALAGCASKPAVKAKTAVGPLKHLNAAFRTAYKSERTALLLRRGPVIVVAFDDLVLLRGGKTQKAGFTPAIYHEAKAIAHIPLTLYVWFQSRTDTPLSPAFRTRLADYRSRIVSADASLTGRPGWTPAVMAPHRAITTAALAFIDDATRSGQVSAAALAGFSRRMRPYVLASADVAGRAQLDGLHVLMGKWRSMLGADWSQTRVVVLTPRQPRAGNLQYAYFLRLMGRGAVNKRLFIAENIFAADGARDLLGTIELDRGASVAFFNDPLRLERDLLADVAKRHVRRLFAKR